jgi:hypothetical protein
MRIGGLDVLFDSLQRQTYRDFELILSDCLWGHRAALVEDKAKDYIFPVRHVEPRRNLFPINAFCVCANEGLVHASGEIAFMAVDYTWFGPRCLEMHASFHDDPANVRTGLTGPHQYRLPPVLRNGVAYAGVEVYDDSQTDQYARDVASGLHNGSMWSVFGQNFEYIEDLGIDGSLRDPKMAWASGPCGTRGFYAKNDSLRLSYLVEVNGWDEALDGSHGYQDWDLAGRLTTKLGISWYHDRMNVVDIVNMRRVLPCGKRLRPCSDNEAMWRRNGEDGYPLPSGRSLAAERAGMVLHVH